MKAKTTTMMLLTMMGCCFAVLSKGQTTRYWIGFGQTWSDNTAWGDVAGTPCNCVPADNDPVIFNSLGADATIDIDLDTRTGAFTMASNYGGTINFGGFYLFSGGAATVTGGTFDATGAADLSFTSMTVNGGTFSLNDAASLTLSSLAVSAGTFLGGSSQVDIGGSVTLSGTGTLTSTSGIMSLFGSTPSFNRTAGTFNNNGGTVNISPSSGTTVIATGLTFNNLGLDNSSGANSARTFTIGTTVNVNGSLILSSTSTARVINMNTGTFNVGGDLDLTNHTASATTSSTASIVLNGVGTQAFIGTSAIGQGKIPQITINKSGGTLTMSGFINVNGNWTYTAGTVSPGTSTVTLYGTRNLGASGMNFMHLNIGQSAAAGSTASVTLTSAVSMNGALTINASSTLTTNNNNVSVGGDVTNSGTLTPGTSTFTCQGSSTQSLAFSNGSALTLNTLTINKTSGTATLANAINVSNAFNPTSGTFNANGNLTLTSTAAGTSAQIGTVGATLSGNYTVQRFLTAGRAWRFLASPVSQTFSSSWQQKIYITGSGTGGTNCPSPSAHTNGFDATTSNAPSIYTYNEPSQSWVALANTNSTSLTPGVGYRVFVRGARTQGCSQLDGSTYTPGTVVLSATGAFSAGTNYGDVSVSVTKSGDGWNLVGNPYQATIDWNNGAWNTARGSNISDEVHTINPSNGNYAYWQAGVATNGGSQYISPGQAFFIKVNTATNLIFREAYKATSQGGAALFKASEEVPVIHVRFNDMTSGTPKFDDETAIAFRSKSDVTRGYDEEYDALTISFTTGNIRTFNANSTSTKYAINSIPTIQVNKVDTVYIEAGHPAQPGDFVLTFKKQNLPQGMTSILVDNFNHQTMNLENNLVYNYATSTDPASKASTRFMLILGGGQSLPVTLSKFTANKSGAKSEIVWQTATEKNNSHFVVERSTDNLEFAELQTVRGSGNSVELHSYQCFDEKPAAGKVNYYRLKQVDYDGNYVLSHVVPVDFTSAAHVSGSSANVSVYPVPAVNTLNFDLAHNYSGNVTVSIFNIDGKNMLHNDYEAGKFSSQSKLDISALPAGIYHVSVLDQASGKTESIKFVKE